MTNKEVINCLKYDTDSCKECSYARVDYCWKIAGRIGANRVKAWDKLKEEIRRLKMNQHSENGDYLTGYMSALSTVEGIMAEWESDNE